MSCPQTPSLPILLLVDVVESISTDRSQPVTATRYQHHQHQQQLLYYYHLPPIVHSTIHAFIHSFIHTYYLVVLTMKRTSE